MMMVTSIQLSSIVMIDKKMVILSAFTFILKALRGMLLLENLWIILDFHPKTTPTMDLSIFMISIP